MANFMNMIAAKPKMPDSISDSKPVTLNNLVGLDSKSDAISGKFQKDLQAVIDQNTKSVESVENADMSTFLEQLNIHVTELISGLMATLEDSELIPKDFMDSKELSLASGDLQIPMEHAEEIKKILQDLLSVIGDNTELADSLNQAIGECEGIVDACKISGDNFVAFAQDPKEIQTQVKTQTETKSNLFSKSVSTVTKLEITTESIEDASSKAKSQIQKVIISWQTITKEVKLSVSNSPTSMEPELQAEGIFAVARLFKSKVENTNVKNDNSVALAHEKPSLSEIIAQNMENHGEGTETNLNFKSFVSQMGSLGDLSAELLNGDNSFKQILGAEVKATPVMQQVIIDQLTERFHILNRAGGTQEIKIQLDPPSLGHVHMKIDMDGSSVNAKLTVESVAVKQTVESNLNQLRTSLEEQGFKVDKFDVHVGYGNEQKFERGDLQERWAMRKGWQKGNEQLSEPLGEPVLSNPVNRYGLDTGRRYGNNTFEMFG